LGKKVMNEEALRAFLARAAKWGPYLKARVRVALAVFTNGDWSIWYSYTAFLPEVPEKVDAFTLETASIRAFRDLVVLHDEKDVEAAIAELRDTPELVEACGWSMKLAASAGALQFEYERVHPDRFAGPKRLPALTAQWTNDGYR
jgi:hypothetical protein